MELFSSVKKRVVFLESFSGGEASGILLIEKQAGKTKGLLCLFNHSCMCPRLLIDDFANVREFDVSPSCTELDLAENLLLAGDLACAVFNAENEVIVAGRALGQVSGEMLERMQIALEKPNQIEHFKKLLGEIVENEKKETTFLNKQNVQTIPSFLDEIKTLLLEIFCIGVPDTRLVKIIPNSKWVKIALENLFIIVGMVVRGKDVEAIGLAVPVFDKFEKVEFIDKSFKFVPQNPNVPDGFGYWIVLQDAFTGKSLPLNA